MALKSTLVTVDPAGTRLTGISGPLRRRPNTGLYQTSANLLVDLQYQAWIK